MQNMSTEYVGKKEKIQNEMTIELNCLLHRVAVSCDLGAALRMESQRIFRSMGRILCQFSLLARIHFNMVCFLLFFLSFSFSLSCFIAIFLCPLPPRALSLSRSTCRCASFSVALSCSPFPVLDSLTSSHVHSNLPHTANDNSKQTFLAI